MCVDLVVSHYCSVLHVGVRAPWCDECVTAYVFCLSPVDVQGSMLGQIERYVKQAIVDNNDTVSSAALLCGLQLGPVRVAVVLQLLHFQRRCVTETLLLGSNFLRNVLEKYS